MNAKINNGIKLFEYLEKLSLLNTNVRINVKKLSKEEEIFELDNKAILPVLEKIFLKSRDVETNKPKDLFFSIERYKIALPPILPKQLEKWINYESIKFVKPEPKVSRFIVEKFEDNKERISSFNRINLNFNDKVDSVLDEWITKNDFGKFEKIDEKQKEIFFKDFPELVILYKNWTESKWEEWKERNYKYFISNQAYDKFYSLRSFLKTEKDSYNLLWGHDILAWKQNNTEIYHPTFFTPVLIDFNSDNNIISIKSDSNSKTFFDVSFVREALSNENRNLNDIDSQAKKVNEKINNDEIDIWNYELIHKYMKRLVRYISPEGESKYNDRDMGIKVKTYPKVFNYHHLFLLKKSGKNWADYAKKIQEDIKSKNILTPFLQDLICDEVNEDEFDDTVKNNKNNLNQKETDASASASDGARCWRTTSAARCARARSTRWARHCGRAGSSRWRSAACARTWAAPASTRCSCTWGRAGT